MYDDATLVKWRKFPVSKACCSLIIFLVGKRVQFQRPIKFYQLVLINLLVSDRFHFLPLIDICWKGAVRSFLNTKCLRTIKPFGCRKMAFADQLDLTRLQILDGGMGSLIENLGYDCSSTVAWSSGANISHPEFVVQAHKE